MSIKTKNFFKEECWESFKILGVVSMVYIALQLLHTQSYKEDIQLYLLLYC